MSLYCRLKNLSTFSRFTNPATPNDPSRTMNVELQLIDLSWLSSFDRVMSFSSRPSDEFIFQTDRWTTDPLGSNYSVSSDWGRTLRPNYFIMPILAESLCVERLESYPSAELLCNAHLGRTTLCRATGAEPFDRTNLSCLSWMTHPSQLPILNPSGRASVKYTGPCV